MRKTIWMAVLAVPLTLAPVGVGRATDPPDADDTARNVRDRNGKNLTPTDQSENSGDRTITQEIRKAVVDKDGMSMNAKNVKIVTVDGVVTLRGPVKTSEEKTTIAQIARQTTGVKHVN